MKSTYRVVSMAVSLIIVWTSLGGVGSLSAVGPVQSSVSFFLNCPGTISFASPASGGECSSGTYAGVYTGVAQTVGSTQNSVFYLASATGGVKVNYSVTDGTSGKLLIRWVGYGSISGGTCSSPSVVLPATPVAGSTSYVIGTGNVIYSGDRLVASLNITFTGTGTPEFCSGVSSATLVSIGTSVVAGPSQPLLSTTLTAGTAVQTTLHGYSGVSETYFNTGSASITALVLGVLKDSSGQTVDLLSTSATATPGVNVTAFLTFKQYPSGTYTLTVIAITSLYVPVSTAATATVRV